MSGSVCTEDDENWLDVDDSISLPTLSLDDVIKQVDSFDDSLLYADVVVDDELSSLVGSAHSRTGSQLGYQLDCPLQCESLDGISHQLHLAFQKGGRPTAIVRHSDKLAVVTSKGLLMLFDEKKQLLLHSSSESRYGSASCVAFSTDGSHVAVGFGKGALKMMTTKGATVVHTVQEAVQPGRGILQIVFLTSQNSVLLLDNGGSVFEMRIKRNFTGRRTEQVRCIFSGCNGEVVFLRYIRRYHLLALVSLTKVLLVSTQRGGSILCAFPLKGPADMPPLLDYCYTSDSSVLLAMCRGESISVYSLIPRRINEGGRAARIVKTITVDRNLVGLRFLSPQSLFGIDEKECVLAVDIHTTTVYRLNEQPDLQMVYATADYKGLATGVDVSAALSCVADNVCYSSVSALADSICVLGGERIFKLKVLTEVDQIEIFQQRKDFASASLYLVDVQKTKVSTRSEKSRLSALSLIPSVLSSLLDWTLDGLSGGRVAELVQHYRKHVDVLLRLCSGTNSWDFFYNFAYQRLERDQLCRAVLLDLLDEYILDGVLDNPPPSIVSDYLKNLIQEGHFSQLQAAVVRIPIQCIDLHAVVSTCRQNALYDGIIYVSNKAFLDFIGPLEEMLTYIAEFSSRELRSDSEVEVGNKLVLYLHCCLAGRAYPFGSLPGDLVDTVPLQVYRCITSLKGKDGVGTGDNYPYLRLLLQFDAQQFLHLICTCADAPLFVTDNRLQRLMEMIGLLCVESRSEHSLCQFLLCVSHLSTNTHFLPPVSIIEEAIHTMIPLPYLRNESEMAVVDVLRCMPQVDVQRPLQLAQRTPIKYKICSHIYTVQRKFIELLNCFIQDGSQPSELFSLINRLLSSDVTRDEYEQLMAYLRENIKTLSSLSPSLCASLVHEHFLDYLVSLSLQQGDALSSAQSHYQLLKACFENRRAASVHSVTSDETVDDSLFSIVFYGLIEKGGEDLDDILCDWLHYWLPLGSSSDQCLNLAASKDAINATVLLMVARGFVASAFQLLEKILIESIEREEEEKILQSIDSLVSFCSSHNEMSHREGWLVKVFKHVTKTAQKTTKGDQADLHTRLLSLTSKVLDGGSGVAVELVESLFETPFFADATYGDHSALLHSLLSTCSFDVVTLDNVIACQDKEIAMAFGSLSKCVSGRMPTLCSGPCVECGMAADKASYAFGCGHILHMNCDNGQKTCPICEREGETGSTQTTRGWQRRRVQKRNIFANWDEQPVLTPP